MRMPNELEFLKTICILLWSIAIALIGTAAICAITYMIRETFNL